MLNMDRKTYEEPSLQELGAMKDITENGSQTFSDTFQGQEIGRASCRERV